MPPSFADNAVADIPLKTDRDGVIRIGQSGVPLESVMSYYREGATAEEIIYAFSSLDAADVHFVLGFALRHPHEIQTYLTSRAAEESRIRDEVERRFNLSELKARIERRRQATGMS